MIGYSARVYGFSLSLVAALLVTGCGASPQKPVSAPVTASAPAPPPAPPRVVACAATPSTVYGDEPVVFDIAGEGTQPVELEVIDSAGRSVHRASTLLPTKVRLSHLLSGDFSLRFASSSVSCQVTVNRELPRATEPLR